MTTKYLKHLGIVVIASLCMIDGLIGAARSEADLAILGLQAGASNTEINSTYRKLALQYHPDRVDTTGLSAEEITQKKQEAEQKFTEIESAKTRLLNAEQPAQIIQTETGSTAIIPANQENQNNAIVLASQATALTPENTLKEIIAKFTTIKEEYAKGKTAKSDSYKKRIDALKEQITKLTEEAKIMVKKSSTTKEDTKGVDQALDDTKKIFESGSNDASLKLIKDQFTELDAALKELATELKIDPARYTAIKDKAETDSAKATAQESAAEAAKKAGQGLGAIGQAISKGVTGIGTGIAEMARKASLNPNETIRNATSDLTLDNLAEKCAAVQLIIQEIGLTKGVFGAPNTAPLFLEFLKKAVALDGLTKATPGFDALVELKTFAGSKNSGQISNKDFNDIQTKIDKIQ